LALAAALDSLSAMLSYEEALQHLARASLADFLAERKRVAAAVRATGDKGNAARIEERRKPTASVWVVNQLYWQARREFDAMLSAAASLRKGDVSASKAYRAALAELHERATAILEKAGLGAGDATLRRVSTTLAAIAADGGFDPDPPGALASDLDPPGFEAAAVPAAPLRREAARPTHQGKSKSAHDRRSERPEERRPEHDRNRRAEDDRARGRAALERERAEAKRRREEIAHRTAARRRLEEELRAARANLHTHAHALAALDREREKITAAASDARQRVSELERQLTELRPGLTYQEPRPPNSSA
jgi:hypothetical protein